MAFDQPPEDDGPGDDPAHDPDKLAELAKACDLQVYVNAEHMGLCFFHAYLACAEQLLQNIIENLRRHRIDPTSDQHELRANEVELAQLLQETSRQLKAQIQGENHWPKTLKTLSTSS